MKQATKDVEQALSVPCRRLEFGPSDVAHAFLRAVSPFVATCPAIKPRVASAQQAATKVSKPPPADLGHQQENNEICQKTCQFDTFLPTVNSSPSRKVIEKQYTIG